jgi:hypothetical protein
MKPTTHHRSTHIATEVFCQLMCGHSFLSNFSMKEQTEEIIIASLEQAADRETRMIMIMSSIHEGMLDLRDSIISQSTSSSSSFQQRQPIDPSRNHISGKPYSTPSARIALLNDFNEEVRS